MNMVSLGITLGTIEPASDLVRAASSNSLSALLWRQHCLHLNPIIALLIQELPDCRNSSSHSGGIAGSSLLNPTIFADGEGRPAETESRETKELKQGGAMLVPPDGSARAIRH